MHHEFTKLHRNPSEDQPSRCATPATAAAEGDPPSFAPVAAAPSFEPRSFPLTDEDYAEMVADCVVAGGAPQVDESQQGRRWHMYSQKWTVGSLLRAYVGNNPNHLGNTRMFLTHCSLLSLLGSS